MFSLALLCILSSCFIPQKDKYEVLFAGRSSCLNGLVIPLDIDLHHRKDTSRDIGLWPDEMSILFEGTSYDCTFYEVQHQNKNTGYMYQFDKTEKTPSVFFVLNENKDVVGYSGKTRLSEEEKKRTHPDK